MKILYGFFNLLKEFVVIGISLLILIALIQVKANSNSDIQFGDDIIKVPKVLILSKTEFLYNNKVQQMDQNFIVISVREHGSDGRFYYVDKDGIVIWAGTISSGAENFRTPSGIFKIYHKKKRWMSTKYPEPSGINNMDYSNFFLRGYAIHQGNPNYMSHGCIHISKKYSKILYKHSPIGTPVIVTRDNYLPHITQREKTWLFN